MKKKRWIGLALLISLVAGHSVSTVLTESLYARESFQIIETDMDIQLSYANRGPITILSDSDFSSYGFPGTGDENSPYRIEGYNITDSNFELIIVENTEAFFVIQNNYLDSITSSLDAIYIRNAANGLVFNNTVVNNRHGIFLDQGCQSMEIRENIVWNSSQSGIRLNDSTDVRIDGNEVVVVSDKVKDPVAVRYGWDTNPACNLFNKEGLPASPFRTDSWNRKTLK